MKFTRPAITLLVKALLDTRKVAYYLLSSTIFDLNRHIPHNLVSKMIEMNKTDALPELLKTDGHMSESTSKNTELPVTSTSGLTNVELVQKWGTERAVEAFQAGDYAIFDEISTQLLYNPALPLFHRAKVC